MSEPKALRVAFLPGNGHVDARLDLAREALGKFHVPAELVSVDYGAHESFDALLDSVRGQVRGASLVYATGIGGLVLLSLRARGECLSPRAILQGPVLWGLETRRFPKIMRAPLMPWLLTLAIRTPPIQSRFVRKHFVRPPGPAFLKQFFGGYRDPRAFQRWFSWLTPGLLRELEAKLHGREDLLRDLEAWWGLADHVVGLEELRLTESALGFKFPLRTYPDWGHYPMIDRPEAWLEEVLDALAPPA